ncbi:hypothetical protein [Shinella sp.]|uniref:hypothetical protein n=1 Tax=Shinella sp. TaxID=1870904 RepID=UPI0039E2E704
MPHGHARDAERIAAAHASTVAAPFLLTPFEIGMTLYRHWLDAASCMLGDQSAHLRNLAECDNPFGMLACHADFSGKSLAAGLDVLRRGAEAAGEDRTLPH